MLLHSEKGHIFTRNKNLPTLSWSTDIDLSVPMNASHYYASHSSHSVPSHLHTLTERGCAMKADWSPWSRSFVKGWVVRGGQREGGSLFWARMEHLAHCSRRRGEVFEGGGDGNISGAVLFYASFPNCTHLDRVALSVLQNARSTTRPNATELCLPFAAHSAIMASTPLPVLIGFTCSHSKTVKFGGCSAPLTSPIVMQGQRVPDHQVIPISGGLKFQAFCPCSCSRGGGGAPRNGCVCAEWGYQLQQFVAGPVHGLPKRKPAQPA